MKYKPEDPAPKVAKLPVWAQEYIQQLTRERDNALRDQREYIDTQTPSPFYVDYDGPENRDKRFVQAHHMTVVWKGVELHISANDYGNSGPGIRLQWGRSGRHGSGDVAFIPGSYQSARLVAKADMD